MGRKKKKQLKPWCWYPFVWDAADAESRVGEGSGAAWRGGGSVSSRLVPSRPEMGLSPSPHARCRLSRCLALFQPREVPPARDEARSVPLLCSPLGLGPAPAALAEAAASPDP